MPPSIPTVLSVRFFKTGSGAEPVREWLSQQDAADKKSIGTEIKTVQIGWPVGMPLVRKMEKDLWEIRITLPKRIVRIFFTVVEAEMILLHVFVKKSQDTPALDLKSARSRMRLIKQAQEEVPQKVATRRTTK